MDAPIFEGNVCITPEGLNFEVKRAKGGLPRGFWETYSAFANTDGGTVVLGVSESDGTLVAEGVPDAQGLIDGLLDAANDWRRVSINLLSDSSIRVLDVGGMRVVAVDVPRAERRYRPVFLDGNPRNCFRRRGDGDYRCTADEVSSMISDSLSGPTDRVPVTTSELSDLCWDTVRAYRNSLRTLKPDHPFNGLDDEGFLRTVGAAVRSDGGLIPTLAGVLMFGQAYCIASESVNYHLDYRRYGDGDEWGYRLSSTDGDWSGNLYDFFIRVMNHIKVEVGRPFSLDGDMRRVDDSLMDACFREMLVNALVNADYRGRSGIAVELRPGSLTVRNPGTFRIPLEEAMEGGFSDPRNRTLSTLFTLIGMVECSGSGVRRMVSACRESGLPDPEFSESVGPDRVTVRVSLLPLGPSGLDGAVLSIIRADGSVSISAMARTLDVPRSSVVGAVNRLKVAGVVERVGGNRGTWAVRDRRRRPASPLRAPADGVQRYAGLALVVPAPRRVVLGGLGVQGLEHHLAEPLAYGQLHRVVGRVVRPQRQGPLEPRVDLAEGADAPAPDPGGPHPELGADVPGHPHALHRGHVEHGLRRDDGGPLADDVGAAADRDLGDPQVVAVRRQPLLDEVPDPDVAGHQALHDVPV